jgi:hypothetical protein
MSRLLLPTRLAAQITRRTGDYVNLVDVTIYNGYISSSDKAYQRAAIKADLWSDRKAKNVLASGGNIAVDSAMLVISPNRDSNENYTEPVAWRALVTKTGKWTLQEGDIVVKGAVTDTISASFTPSQLRAKYDNMLVVSSVDTLDDGMSGLRIYKVSAK